MEDCSLEKEMQKDNVEKSNGDNYAQINSFTNTSQLATTPYYYSPNCTLIGIPVTLAKNSLNLLASCKSLVYTTIMHRYSYFYYTKAHKTLYSVF